MICIHIAPAVKSTNTLIEYTWNNMQGKRTFVYRSTKLWNKLPDDIKTNFKSMTLSNFKHSISNPHQSIPAKSYLVFSYLA